MSDTDNARQARMKVFGFLIDYKREHDGTTPTISEICRFMRLRSKSQVHAILKEMCDVGMIYPIQSSQRVRAYGIRGGVWTFKGKSEIHE